MAKRWEERISDLNNAINRLEEAIEDSKKIELSTLKDGVIQRFEFTVELSWKALKNYLNSEGIDTAITPKSSVREAFKIGIIENVNTWIEMLDDRNLTSHTYNQLIADEIYERIVNQYYKELKNNFEFLKNKEV